MNLYVRRKSNHEVMTIADVTGMNNRQIEQVIIGVARELDHRQFYIDDHECWGNMPDKKRTIITLN